MSSRAIWEEKLFTSNVPLPRRKITRDHPLYGLPLQYIVDGQPLTPWSLVIGMADPIPREWLPLREHHEAVYLSPPSGQTVRVALVDYENGVVVAWRLTAGSKAYQPRKPRREPPP